MFSHHSHCLLLDSWRWCTFGLWVSFVSVASVHISQKQDTLGTFAHFSRGIKCNTSLVLNKRDLPKRGPLTEERLSNLPLFCIWVTYSLWYWESLKVSRAERGGRGKKKSSIASLHFSFDAAFRRRWTFSLPWLDAFPPDRNLRLWKETVVHTNSPLLFSTARTNGSVPWWQPSKAAAARFPSVPRFPIHWFFFFF